MKLTHRQAEAVIAMVDGRRIMLNSVTPGDHWAQWSMPPCGIVHMNTFMALQRRDLIESVRASREGLVTEWAATEKAREFVSRLQVAA